MSLGVLTLVLEWIEQLRVHSSCQARARFLRHRSHLFCVCSGIVKPQFTNIGHQDLVATLFQHPACPRGVGSGLYGYAHWRML
jgi:hypothetical protein